MNKTVSETLQKTSIKLKNCKLYEKRLMYLIFLAVEEGYPVDKLYKERVGTLSSRVFEEMSNHHDDSSLFNSIIGSTIIQNEPEIKLIDDSEGRSSQVFDSNASYDQIQYANTPQITKRPSQVGVLDFNKLLPNIESSSGNSTKKLDLNAALLEDRLLRFRKFRSHDDIFLSL